MSEQAINARDNPTGCATSVIGMLAAFNDTWDWTAIGTLALAVVTLVAVIVGAFSLRQTRKAIALSRREVEEAHRPVVVPVVIARPPDLGAQSVSRSRRTFPDRPSVAESGVLAVPIQNIGSGPALCVVASIQRLDEHGERYTGAIEHQTPGKVAGLGKGQTVPIEIRYHGWEERWNFELTLVYADVAGKRWATICRYVAEHERYEGVTIEVRTLDEADQTGRETGSF